MGLLELVACVQTVVLLLMGCGLKPSLALMFGGEEEKKKKLQVVKCLFLTSLLFLFVCRRPNSLRFVVEERITRILSERGA